MLIIFPEICLENFLVFHIFYSPVSGCLQNMKFTEVWGIKHKVTRTFWQFKNSRC